MDAEQRYNEAERIAIRMGFHLAFAQSAAAEGSATELARARTRGAHAGLAGRRAGGRRWRP